jgi:hypothetical protein
MRNYNHAKELALAATIVVGAFTTGLLLGAAIISVL